MTAFNVTTIGARNNGAWVNFFNGYIAELIVLDNPTTETRQKLEGYLAHKWGLEARLPSGHPYTSAAPGAPGVAVTLDDASVTDEDSGGIFTATWSVVDQPAGSTVTFDDVNLVNATVTLDTEGIYTLQLTADDGFDVSDDQVIITVGQPEIRVSGGADLEIVSGDDAPDLADGTDFGDVEEGSTKDVTFTIANIGTFVALELDGSPIVSIDNPTFTLQTPPSATVAAGTDTTIVIRFAPTSSGLQTATISIANNDADENPYTFDVRGNGTSVTSATVVATHIFYNNSAWDGDDANAAATDDAAIATDKAPLLPGDGEAVFANYVSCLKGVNGIMVDMADLGGYVPVAPDFAFKAGNTLTPGTWGAAPAPTSITVRAGAGLNGSDRVTIIWDDADAIKNQWLQVTVLANGGIGLGADTVFYYGSAIAETGNDAASTAVDVFDMLGARNNVTEAGGANVENPYDFNRDKAVDVFDMLGARNNVTDSATELKLITPP